MTVVKTEALVKDYELNGITVNALRGVDIYFEAGEFAAVATSVSICASWLGMSSSAYCRSVL